MAKVNQKFVDSFLYGKLLEALKNLNQVKDALDPEEKDLLKKLDDISQSIIGIEI